MFSHFGRSTSKLSAVLIACVCSPMAAADVIYDWTGTCDFGCVGTATATLVLNDSYAPGTALTTADFLSFSYASSNGSYAVPGDQDFEDFFESHITPAILPFLSGFAVSPVDLNPTGNTTYHFTDSDGFWLTQFVPILGVEVAEGGFDYVWTRRVPEPGTLALLGIGLFALRLSRRRERVRI